jgi:hypothetical protein
MICPTASKRAAIPGNRRRPREMRATYEATIALARERPEWLAVLKTCYLVASKAEPFAGSWVFSRHKSSFPSLRTLAAFGLLEKVDTSRRGKRAYYRMPDREGLGRALEDLGLLEAQSD